MAKIAIFIGRKHHAEKLKNVGMALVQRGHEVVALTANNAINIDPPQIGLGDYIHVYNYLDKKTVELSNGIIDYNDIYSETPSFWKYYSTRELVLSYLAFKNYLQSEDKPDGVLILHENNFWTKTLAFLCLKYDIPCFSFQEGLLREQDQERFNKQGMSSEYSTLMFVWGEDSYNQYKKAGVDESKMVVSGPPHLALASKKKTQKRQKVVTYFLPLLQHYGGDAMNDLRILNTFCLANGHFFLVRPHPFEKDYIDLPLNIDREDDIELTIVNTDVAIVQHSTTAVECLALGTPIIEMALGKFLQPLSSLDNRIPSIKSVDDLGLINTTLEQNYLTPDFVDSFVKNQIFIPNQPTQILDIIISEIEAYL